MLGNDVRLEAHELSECRSGAGRGLPLVVEVDAAEGRPLADILEQARELAARHLHRSGALLFRGFDPGGAEGFRSFVTGFGYSLADYDYGSTPRSARVAGVYSSTEYPAHQTISLHNEQAYTRAWPMKLWFCCLTAARVGGQTPIADSRAIHDAIPEDIRQRFADRGLLYQRNFGSGLDLSWSRAFGSESRADVEAYCRAHRITWEWKPDDGLRTLQPCPAVARHPVTDEAVWFNQAHLFHVSALEPEVREVLLEVVDEADLPRNVYYGDGGVIEDEVLAVVRDVLRTHEVVFDWREGDVMMLDNMLAAHGRAPFEGPREVVVAMAEARSLD